MAAEVDPPTPPMGHASDRWTRWIPWLGLAAWAGGAIGLWYIGKSYSLTTGDFVLLGCGWILVLALVAHNAVRNMFGPVFMYEVIRLGRKRTTFVMRLLYVLAIMALLGILYLSWLESVGYFANTGQKIPFQRMSQFANTFFYTFLGVQFGVLVVLTPAYVAGTVADEKERKTLEFLLATDLKNREIIFGKLAARVTNLLMFVLAGLPVVAFMQLFGGIDPEQLLAGILATVITVLGISAVSIYFSTISRKPRDAIAMTYMVIAVYVVVSFVLGWYLIYLQIMTGRGGSTPIIIFDYELCDDLDVINAVKVLTDWFAAGNPGYVLVESQNPMTGKGLSSDSMGTMLFRYSIFWGLLSTLLVGYSVARLRTIALDQGPGGSLPKRAKSMDRRVRYRPALGDDPMIWKEVFVDGGVRGGCAGAVISLVVLALVFCVPVIIFYNTLIDPPSYGGYRNFGERWEDFVEGMNVWCRVATGILGFLLMIGAAVRGAGTVSGERDRDTWISLISTPLSAWEMLRGKWLGTILGLRRAFAVLILIWVVSLLIGAVDPPMMLATVICTVVYVCSFAWIGIYCSITARTTLIATVRALLISVFMAGGFWVVIGLCCMVPIGMMFRGPGDDWIGDIGQILLGWTPPFVMGWMPLLNYERSDMEPFAMASYNGRMEGIGPFSPVLGVIGWAGIGFVFAVLSWEAFQRASNRSTDKLGPQLPRPRRSPESSSKPALLPVAKPRRPPPKVVREDEIVIVPDDEPKPESS